MFYIPQMAVDEIIMKEDMKMPMIMI